MHAGVCCIACCIRVRRVVSLYARFLQPLLKLRFFNVCTLNYLRHYQKRSIKIECHNNRVACTQLKPLFRVRTSSAGSSSSCSITLTRLTFFNRFCRACPCKRLRKTLMHCVCNLVSTLQLLMLLRLRLLAHEACACKKVRTFHVVQQTLLTGKLRHV